MQKSQLEIVLTMMVDWIKLPSYWITILIQIQIITHRHYTADERVYCQRQDKSLLLTSTYNITLQTNVFITVTRQPLLLTLKYNITLKTNMFIASDEGVLCWRQTLLALETNAFHAGDQHFSAGDEQVKNAGSNFSHTHTASYQQLPNRTYVDMIASHSYSLPKTGSITLRRSKRYLDAHLTESSASLNWSTRPNKQKNYSQTSFYSQLVVSKPVAACNGHVQQSRFGLTIHAMPGLCEQKPHKLLNENTMHLQEQF